MHDQRPPPAHRRGQRLRARPRRKVSEVTPAPTPRLTVEALSLLDKVETGGVPSFTTSNLERIARENGVTVSESMTPNDIIEELRRKADQSA